MDDLLTIVIVSHNSEQVIGACLRTLPANVRKIVMDNGSGDRSAEIAASYPGVEIIHSANIGYGKAANAAFAKVETPYVLLLNPDVEIDERSISAMVECMKRRPGLGMVGARMFRMEQGNKIYERACEFAADGTHRTDWIVGAAMFMEMQALRTVEMFDENIFLFYEESDLCKRFIKAGYELAICAGAEAYHVCGTSCPRSLKTTKIRAWHCAWSRAYYYKKHYGVATMWLKSLVKLGKNLLGVVRYPFCPQKRRMLHDAYEVVGALAFLVGISAYDKQGRARLA